jgi:hypothetical protein
MSKQLISELEDGLHAAAHRANAAGLSLNAIADALADRAYFAAYMVKHNGTKYPPVVSAATSARRRGHA